MNDYTFPFSTCEKKTDDGIFAQPYSAIANIITCFIIIYFLLKTENIHSFLLLFSILVFELFHAFSHMIHIPGTMQINITHILAYCMNIAFFNVFYNVTRFFPSYLFLLYMSCVILFDIYAFFNFSFVYYLASSSLIFISMLLYYYPILPTRVKNSIHLIIAIILIVIGMFFNESYNCNIMLSAYPGMPYHIIIEITGMYLFYVICSAFYKL